MSNSILEILNNPLMRRGDRDTNFLRLVLAEAASFGLPPQLVAAIDDTAAMLGLYDPLPAGQIAHIAGPLVTWRTHRFQPDYQTVVDVAQLAYKQRALIGFGGAPPGH